MDLTKVFGLQRAPSPAVFARFEVIAGINFDAKQELDHVSESVELEELMALFHTL